MSATGGTPVAPKLFRQGDELDAEIAELVVALLPKLDKGIFRKRLLRGLDLSLRALNLSMGSEPVKSREIRCECPELFHKELRAIYLCLMPHTIPSIKLVIILE